MKEERITYTNHMNILHQALELIDIEALTEACKDEWYNQTLCRVNDSVVRLGIVKGQYHWHKHDTDDEFFLTLEGKLLIDIEGADSVELKPFQGYVVPRGVVHRTRAQEKTVMLMIETAGIVPTGDD